MDFHLCVQLLRATVKRGSTYHTPAFRQDEDGRVKAQKKPSQKAAEYVCCLHPLDANAMIFKGRLKMFSRRGSKMHWHKKVVLFFALAGLSVFAVTLPDKLVPWNCSADAPMFPFLVRLVVYSALPVAFHLLIYALFFPNLTAKRIVVSAGIFHLAVILPFFILVWGLGWAFSLLAGWWIFPEQSWFSLWHSVFTLLPPSVIAITTTLWLLKKPYFSDISGQWETAGRVLFLLFMGASIWALGIVQVILTFGCL